MSDNEFIEIFELAAPGKEFELYSENKFKRKRDAVSKPDSDNTEASD